MSIPPNSPGRGCAAAYPEPLSEDRVIDVETMEEDVYYHNCRMPYPGTSRLDEIVYRSSDRDYDKLHHVFRWAPESRATYQQVFQNGFQVTDEHTNEDGLFCSLYHYIHQVGRPVQDRDRSECYAYISTTINTGWQPHIDQGTTGIQYRFEIYAPGGIWIAQTLGDHYNEDLCSQDEVIFVGAIVPQYIRSVQRFRVDPNPATSRFSRLVRADSEIIINGNFRPHPTMLIHIQNPVYYCLIQEEDGRRRDIPLNRLVYFPPHDRKKGQVSTDSNVIDWYASEVANIGTYINAAFRAYNTNEAYIFMNNEYLLLNYAPLTTDDKVVNGPLLIRDGFPSLVGTAFAEWGIDCAFASHDGTEAFIFSGNLCAYIDYAPGSTTDDKIIKGPMTITAMFPFFKGTVFESGIDAAFEAQTKYEAYLFKGNQYALINYNNPKLIATRSITQGFGSLRGTIFRSGIDAAFASHRSKEAYLFKGDSYALLEFASGGSYDDRIIGGIKKILPNWPSLQKVLPRKNGALDLDYNHITTGGPAP